MLKHKNNTINMEHWDIYHGWPLAYLPTPAWGLITTWDIYHGSHWHISQQYPYNTKINWDIYQAKSLAYLPITHGSIVPLTYKAPNQMSPKNHFNSRFWVVLLHFNANTVQSSCFRWLQSNQMIQWLSSDHPVIVQWLTSDYTVIHYFVQFCIRIR